jgi:hypothetical protein
VLLEMIVFATRHDPTGMSHKGLSMFNVTDESPIPLRDVPKLGSLPMKRGDHRIALATVYRWSHRGVRGHVLETLMIGGTRCTSLLALQRFFERISMPTSMPMPPTPSQRAAAIVRAEKVLAQARI